uniref:Uncharacterized protein n=1 Tax=Anopheles albimanus TaxID=7167 RepID=A0A182FXL9_ANOAL
MIHRHNVSFHPAVDTVVPLCRRTSPERNLLDQHSEHHPNKQSKIHSLLDFRSDEVLLLDMR